MEDINTKNSKDNTNSQSGLVIAIYIIALVTGVLGIISSIFMLAFAYNIATEIDNTYVWDVKQTDYSLFAFIIVWFSILLALNIAVIWLSTIVYKKMNNNINYKRYLIALLVLSCFANTILLVLCIIELCTYGKPQKAQCHDAEFRKSVARIKQYFADGIIDKTMYDAKILELVKGYVETL